MSVTQAIILPFKEKFPVLSLYFYSQIRLFSYSEFYIIVFVIDYAIACGCQNDNDIVMLISDEYHWFQVENNVSVLHI